MEVRCTIAIWCLALARLVVSTPAVGEETCLRTCEQDIACELQISTCLVDESKVRDAIDRLKPLVKLHPNHVALARLLARAYLEDNNPFWAQRVLQQVLANNPNDCETLSWLAWVYIGEGDLELARETMLREPCPVREADRTRWRVLAYHISRATSDGKGEQGSLDTFNQAKEAYPEDEWLIRHLRFKENPGWIEPLSFRLDIQGGYTSNDKAGSPTDPSGEGDSGIVGRFDLFGRLVLPMPKILRPMLEVDAKGNGYPAEDSRELSYMDFSIRPGFILGRGFPRATFAYKGNLMLLDQEDKELFYESHRGEAELETGFGLLAFAGAGRRIFREAGRTRTELDGGLGYTVSPHKQIKLLFALTGRYHWAVGQPYDLAGGTALAAGLFTFGPGFSARLGVTPSIDYYPNSGGNRGKDAFGTEDKRLDFTIKQFEELWSPSLHGLGIGLRYEFSWRDSSADQGESNYDYQEHRVLLALRYTFSLNPWAPSVVESKEHVGLDYGIVNDKGSLVDDERIQDLLRQDEAARAGSSCVD